LEAVELSPDFQSLPTQNIYIEKLAGGDWKKEVLGENSNYYIISKTVAHPLIYSILFPQQSKVRLFIPFRNGNDIIVPFCRLSLTRDSFVSATVMEWNNLNISVRNLDTLSKFKKAIRSSISMPIPIHYSYGPRKLNIIITHLRCNASFLNCDLSKVKILSNASCNCGAPCENSHHFFLDCDKYTDNKDILFNSLNWLPSNINIDVNLLTKGSDLLTYQEKITIFKHAFKYIKDSNRSTIV
jgi:hypothetical protein